MRSRPCPSGSPVPGPRSCPSASPRANGRVLTRGRQRRDRERHHGQRRERHELDRNISLTPPVSLRAHRSEPRANPLSSIAPMSKLTVKLPDGSPLELEPGATGADAAAAIGPRLAAGRARDQGRRRAARPGAPLPDGAEIAIVTAQEQGRRGRGRALADPPRRRARDGDRGGRAVARGEGLDRAADRRRLLLRLRVPRGRGPERRRPRADRGGDARAHRRRRAVRAQRAAGGGGDRALSRRRTSPTRWS